MRAAAIVIAFVIVSVFGVVQVAHARKDPVAFTTAGVDGGPVVLRSALESFGIPVPDYAALVRECGQRPDGVSVDDLETVANRRGLQAVQQIVHPDDLLRDSAHFPGIVIVGDAKTRDFWLVWRGEGERFRILDPHAGLRWVSRIELAKRLFIHEMELDAATWRAFAYSQEQIAQARGSLTTLGIAAPDRILAEARSSDAQLQRLDAAIRTARRGKDGKAQFEQMWSGRASVPADAFLVSATSGDKVWLHGAVIVTLRTP